MGKRTLRVATNYRRLRGLEAHLRVLIEKIGVWPQDQEWLLWIVCECDRGQCDEGIQLLVTEYRAIWDRSPHFAVSVGHQLPDERVVFEGAEYLVVAV